jgi:hypothetical protein
VNHNGKDYMKLPAWLSKPPVWLFMVIFVVGLILSYVWQANKTAAIAEDVTLVIILLVGIAQRRLKQPKRR